jgi:cysteine sulfinate desulfinase/cysteine desulfurase-like protein
MGFHGSAVRFSTGAKTTQAEIDAAIAAVSTVIARL